MPKRDEIGRENEKKILVPNSVHTRSGHENFEKNRKKIQKVKTSFWHYFWPKRDEMGRESEKKNLVPNSLPTQPELENSKKKKQKNSKS